MQVHWSLTVSSPLYTPPNLNTQNYYLHKSLSFLPQTPPFQKQMFSLTVTHTHADTAMVHWLCAQPSLYLFV